MGRTETGFAALASAAGVELLFGAVVGLTSRGPWAAHLEVVPRPVVDALVRMHEALGGDQAVAQGKRESPLRPDFLLASGQIVEVDEIQHFTSVRATTLDLYPQGLPLGFDLDAYREFCESHRGVADRYRAAKPASDFPFPGGRRAQRAFFDATRDLLAPYLTGHPVLRVPAPEFDPAMAWDRVRDRLTSASRTAERTSWIECIALAYLACALPGQLRTSSRNQKRCRTTRQSD